MIDPTEYDPNSRDSTDDPDFVGDANHIGNLTDMVVGDNDHGDAIPEPKCGVCLCNKALKEDLRDSLEVAVTDPRDVAKMMDWDCFKQEPLPLKRKTKKEYDPRVISLEELERTTRNLRMND